MKNLLYVVLLGLITMLNACDKAESAKQVDPVQSDNKPAEKVSKVKKAVMDGGQEAVASTPSADFSEKFAKYFPDLKPDSISPTPINGIVEVVIGARVFYFSEDARYLLDGKMIDVQTRTNISNPSLYKARLNLLNVINEDKMIVFSPENPKYTVTVITDIDCGYCRKMHSQMAEYNKLGIAIRYLFFPRAGINSDSYHKAVSVWCSKNQKKALTEAKRGKKIETQSCDHPINSHMKLVQDLELSGTPALLFSSGHLILSYIPPAQLLNVLKDAG